MREIKFRAWNKDFGHWQYNAPVAMPLHIDKTWSLKPDPDVILMQYTGLKDKNGLQEIYECDIIGVDGMIKGNKYENTSLLQDSTNLAIKGFGTKDWWATYKEAMARGCKDAE